MKILSTNYEMVGEVEIWNDEHEFHAIVSFDGFTDDDVYKALDEIIATLDFVPMEITVQIMDVPEKETFMRNGSFKWWEE